MNYLLALIEGIITFISPCFLPMVPIYLTYLAGGAAKGSKDSDGKTKVVRNAFAFVIGFSIVFILLGAASGTIGQLLKKYSNIVNIISGLIMILFGLNYLKIFKIPFLNKTIALDFKIKKDGMTIFSSIILGIIFSIGWTPCVGVFLGSVLMLAADSKNFFEGFSLLIVYSLGLGIPFIISAILLEKMYGAFDFIKKHYKIINLISGTLLVIIGILMLTGNFSKLLQLLG